MRRPCALLPAFLLACLGLAQDPSHILDAVVLDPAPTIDGVVNDDEWKQAPKTEGMYDSQDGTAAPERSEFWLAYDKDFIYFAAKLYDSQPSTIKMTEYRTNSSLTGDDLVQFDIDPYGALTDWNQFAINPRGATKIQIAGGRAAKREWIGEFVAKARLTDFGWEAEARIPWKLIKLPGAGPRDVRFDFDRFMPRTNRWYGYTKIVGGDLTGVGRWKQVDLPKIEERRVLQLLPYNYVGYDPDGYVFNSGLDLKMPVSDQMTLVGTVNPDFRNIENQILSIDFSRFERLAGESRPFFQEGQQYYGSELIATQRIDNFDAGLNLYGKVNEKLSMGIVNTTDFGNENDLMTTWQFSPDTVSQVRFSHTSLDSDEVTNRGYLLAYGRQFPNWNLFFRGMHTDDEILGSGDERRASVFWSNAGVNVFGMYRQVSPDFKPRLGFQPEVDFKGFQGSVGWNRVFKSGPLAETFIGSYGTKYDRYHGGDYRTNQGFDLNFAFREGLELSANADFSKFLGSDDHTYTLNLRRPRSDPYRNASVGYTWGEIEGIDYRSVSAGFAYRPVEKLQLNLSSQFVDYGGKQEQIILSGNYDLGQDRSISGRVVKTDDDVNAYVALRRSGNAGMEYFLILGDPNARKFRESLILKVTFPLQVLLGK